MALDVADRAAIVSRGNRSIAFNNREARGKEARKVAGDLEQNAALGQSGPGNYKKYASGGSRFDFMSGYTLDSVRDHLYRHYDPFSTLTALLAFSPLMERNSWLRLLGEFWSCCDNIGQHRLRLRRELGTSGPLYSLMTEDEIQKYDALPEIVTCYRGCGPGNVLGACWSLERRVANSFPFTNRYRCSEPLLVTGRVRKQNILAVKSGREEAEIISFSVQRLRVESADRPEAEVYHAEKYGQMLAHLKLNEGGTGNQDSGH